MKKIRTSITAKSILGIVALLIFFSAVVSIIGYRELTQALWDQYAQGAFRTAYTAARLVKPDKIDDYMDEGEVKSEEYNELYDRLDILCNTQEATFVYIIIPDRPDYEHITFVLSTMNRNSNYDRYERGYYKETTNDEYRNDYKGMYEDGLSEALVIRDKGDVATDSHITAMLPLKNSEGETVAILCVQRQMAELAATRRGFLNMVMLTMVITLIIAAVIELVYLDRMMLAPIRIISNEAERFAAEGVKPGWKLTQTIKNKDQLGKLAGSIDKMEEQIQDYVENLTKITAEKERISTELSLATRIQADMLPNIYPAFPDREEFDIYASMHPAKEVGGDFYDYFLIDNDHLCMVIADVSGKGVPAALFMMASKIIIANSIMLGISPAEALDNANQLICASNREEMFVSVWLGILEISTGIIRASNAGHEYPVIKHPDGDYEILKDQHGLIIGMLEEATYSNYEIRLQKGSRIFLYTDGVPEATDIHKDMFGMDRMVSVLNFCKGLGIKEVIENVHSEVMDFTGEAEQFDDVTMLCLEYMGDKSK